MLALNDITNILPQGASPQSLKPLDQRERRILNLGIQALLRKEHNQDTINLQNSWDSIRGKISSNPN